MSTGETQFQTGGGITVSLAASTVDGNAEIENLVDRLDEARGVLLSSSYEYPGRYTRWDMGFADPPLAITSRAQDIWVSALNERGAVLLEPVHEALAALGSAAGIVDLRHETGDGSGAVVCRVERADRRFEEEERSRQPSTFTVVRALVNLFSCDDPHLGLYGAFGYDLAFQFEPIALTLPRPAEQRDLVLYLPDDLLIVDHEGGIAQRFQYDFAVNGRSTAGLAVGGARVPYEPDFELEASCDHEPGGYAAGVRAAHEYFARGDLFEVVTSQMFSEPCIESPAELFRRLKEQNPAPYGFLINLGPASAGRSGHSPASAGRIEHSAAGDTGEWLIGASPEMYVRVEGERVETCPISGTIARGQDPIDDASQILALLNSAKDESELTMCTDVDRNDKSRICVPGSVKVIGRRQIEMYSRLIHTVDHVEGRLRSGFDALDAFLSHTWAVTVTGAPKTAAMMFLEQHERTARAWYGGAVGKVGFDGSLNTGLTLRTIRVADGHAEVRVGATLLWDSEPDEEESETELKASAFLDAIRRPRSAAATGVAASAPSDRRVLLVDHLDSFVHTLANYLRQTGATVVTRRAGFSTEEISADDFDLIVLSPGPGRPDDFSIGPVVRATLDAGLPLFGVCLGLQGIVEYFGGELGQLATPMHGKPSAIRILGGQLLDGLPKEFRAGRYHSLFARRSEVPDSLEVTAVSLDDDIVMAVEHRELPVAAVQFHPESIMSLDDGVGLALIRNAVDRLVPGWRAG
ncbi:anthranilate synthase component I [Candidatus Poriferisodalis sp.]|uniref:anthranilate synthase component I n=1 Tax=Candidatus Poriferisodalis sp. TaxID=3101277 RepID=UPI003B02C191